VTTQHANAGDTAYVTTAQPSSVDLYLQFAQFDTDHLAAGHEGQSNSPSAEHAVSQVIPTVEEYLQLGGVDPAHLSQPDPAQSPNHQPPPDSPLHPGATMTEPTDSGYHDTGLAHTQVMPIPDGELQHHG